MTWIDRLELLAELKEDQMTLQEKAKLAYDKHEEAQVERYAEMATRTKEIFIEVFGEEPDAASHAAVHKDGLRFRCWREVGRPAVALICICDRCGDEFDFRLHPDHLLVDLHKALISPPKHKFCTGNGGRAG